MNLNRNQIILFLSSLFALFITATFAQNTDINLLREINQSGNNRSINFTQVVSDSTSVIVFSTMLILLGLSFFKRNRSLRDQSFLLIVSVLVADGLSSLIKIIVQRQRPFETYLDIIKYGDGGSFSFPSGHTTEAFAFATAISLAYRKWYIVVPAYLWACLVGFSRIHLGTHYPSDVVAGILVGTGCSFLCFKTVQWYQKRKKSFL